MDHFLECEQFSHVIDFVCDAQNLSNKSKTADISFALCKTLKYILVICVCKHCEQSTKGLCDNNGT